MDNFTLNEILTQPEAWQAALEKRSEIETFIRQNPHQCDQEDMFFIGCGTSYYLALSAASVLMGIAGKRARALTASDTYLFADSLFKAYGENALGIVISRSGTTTEAVWAAERLKKGSIPVCSISCRKDSELVLLGNYKFVIPEADEKSVVMTRSFTSMLLLIQMLAGVFAGNGRYMKNLYVLPGLAAGLIKKHQHSIRQFLDGIDAEKYVYLGQGPYYGLACESMLKIKEMSLSVSEAYHTLEFRHGPMSLVATDMLITFFLSDSGTKEEVAVLHEMKKRGAKTLVICEKSGKDIDRSADLVIELRSNLDEFERMILYMPVTQLIGYYQALRKGLNPDLPKNLTQVVQIR